MEIEVSVLEESESQQSIGCNNGLTIRFPKQSEVILFVDDEILLTQLGTNMLERMGYRTKTCTSGTKALSLFDFDPTGYDLLITDLFMPEMSGVDLCSACKTIRPDFPVIITSGQNFLDSVYQKKIEALNIEAILHKPYSFRGLTSIVQMVLDKQRNNIRV